MDGATPFTIFTKPVLATKPNKSPALLGLYQSTFTVPIGASLGTSSLGSRSQTSSTARMPTDQLPGTKDFGVAFRVQPAMRFCAVLFFTLN